MLSLLSHSLVPITGWAEAGSRACGLLVPPTGYVLKAYHGTWKEKGIFDMVASEKGQRCLPPGSTLSPGGCWVPLPWQTEATLLRNLLLLKATAKG